MSKGSEVQYSGKAGTQTRVTIPVIEVPADATEFEKKKVRHASGASVVSAAESLGHWIPTPPDGGYGWVIVLAAFFNHIIMDGIAYTFGVFYTAFINSFPDEDPAKVSLVGSLLGGFYMFSAPVAGAMVNKFGCRPVAIAGALIAVTGFVLSVFSTTIEALIITYGVIGGTGLGTVILPNIIAVSYYFEKKRAMATGIAVCGAGVGCFVFAPLGQFLLEFYGWPSAMLTVAGIVLNSCVFSCLLIPLMPPGPPKSRRTRSKNILDRLKEQTAHRRGRHRKSSECSEYGGGGGGANNQQELLLRMQMIKLAKESALKDEEDEAGTDPGGSVLNSIMTLGGENDVSSPVGARSQPIDIVGQRGSLGSGGGSASYGHTPEGGLIASVIASRGLHDLAERDESNLEEEMDEEGEGGESQAGTSPPASVKSPRGRKRPDSAIVGSPSVVLDSSLTVGDDSASRQISILDSNADVVGPSRTTLNQPLGSVPEGELMVPQTRPNRNRGDSNRLRLPDGVSREDYARPLYRQDIFYSGSIIQLSQYRSQPDVQNYTKSVIAIPAEAGSVDKESIIWRKLPLWKEAKDALRGMTDCTLFTEPLFLLPVLSNLFATIGLYVPFVFLKERADSYHVSNAAFLLSIIGVTNTIGRVVAGMLASLPWCNSLLLHNAAIVLAGVACFLNIFTVTYPTMCIYAAIYGLCIAVWISLTSIVLCDLLGLEKLTNAFGLLCMARGCAAAVGAPIGGILMGQGDDKDYDAPFVLSGAMLILGALFFIVLHAPYFQRRKSGALTAPVDAVLPEDEWANIDFDLENEVTSNGGVGGSNVGVDKSSVRFLDSAEKMNPPDYKDLDSSAVSCEKNGLIPGGDGMNGGTKIGSPSNSSIA